MYVLCTTGKSNLIVVKLRQWRWIGDSFDLLVPLIFLSWTLDSNNCRDILLRSNVLVAAVQSILMYNLLSLWCLGGIRSGILKRLGIITGMARRVIALVLVPHFIFRAVQHGMRLSRAVYGVIFLNLAPDDIQAIDMSFKIVSRGGFVVSKRRTEPSKQAAAFARRLSITGICLTVIGQVAGGTFK